MPPLRCKLGKGKGREEVPREEIRRPDKLCMFIVETDPPGKAVQGLHEALAM